MRIAIASDHAGFALKQYLVDWLTPRDGLDVADLGTDNPNDSVDYPDFAQVACNSVVTGGADRAIVVCGSGAGACITANKIRGIRAAVCHDVYTAHQCVEHDDVQVLCLGGRIIGTALAEEIVDSFLAASYTQDERHARRLEKISQIENAS